MSKASAAHAAHWLALIEGQLREIATRLEHDMDLPPAQHFQFEGLVAAAHADGIALDELQRFCASLVVPPSAVRIDAEHKTLQFDFWQKRAPVYPSTSE